MRKILTFMASSLLFLLLIGAGCSQNEENSQIDTSSKPAENQTSIDNSSSPPEQQGGGIVLKAETLGNGQVKFEWTVPDEFKSNDGYALVRGTEANPTYPSMYWYLMGPSHREKVWSGLPVGKAHFRLCQYENKSCTAYSNNVEVEVQ